MRRQIVPRIAAKVLIPYILLYALYVQWHGDYGPGGGFQAGVIFAAAVILYALVFDLRAAQRFAAKGGKSIPTPAMFQLSLEFKNSSTILKRTVSICYLTQSLIIAR